MGNNKRRRLDNMSVKVGDNGQVIREGNVRMVTARTSVNIAVIKYWGKEDESLILPINDSLSGTLNTDDLSTMTTVATSPSFTKDQMWLNNEEVIIEHNKRLVQCLKEMRARGSSSVGHIRICSFNDFPTAAGLASSAAGYACLVYALGHLFGITDKPTLSTMARMGSGSAIRSIDGGFVQWVKGTSSETSVAKQIVDHNYWPEMRVLILVVNDKRKETSSTKGMQLSVETSDLIRYRAEHVVPKRIDRMITAIKNKDFETFAELTMKDSNQFHAIAADTYPPIRYMNGLSWEIIRLVHAVNSFFGTNKVAYTFDAGPNACLYLLEDSLPLILSLVTKYFPFGDADFIQGQPLPAGYLTTKFPQGLVNHLENEGVHEYPNSLKYVINTKIGKGAELVTNHHLLDDEGNPTNQQLLNGN